MTPLNMHSDLVERIRIHSGFWIWKLCVDKEYISGWECNLSLKAWSDFKGRSLCHGDLSISGRKCSIWDVSDFPGADSKVQWKNLLTPFLFRCIRPETGKHTCDWWDAWNNIAAPIEGPTLSLHLLRKRFHGHICRLFVLARVKSYLVWWWITQQYVSY